MYIYVYTHIYIYLYIYVYIYIYMSEIWGRLKFCEPPALRVRARPASSGFAGLHSI